jgi:hypothetical protein
MANQQVYTNALVYIDDALLSQESRVTVRRMSGSNPVDTTALGYAGESPGSPRVEIDVTNAVPSADFEFNPGQFMKLLRQCKVTIFAAGKQLTSKGQIFTDNFSHSVNAETTLEFQFRGGFADWQ